MSVIRSGKKEPAIINRAHGKNLVMNILSEIEALTIYRSYPKHKGTRAGPDSP